MPPGNALLLILDGVGFNRARARAIIDAVWLDLTDTARRLLIDQATSILARDPSSGLRPEGLAQLSLYPIAAEALDSETPLAEALSTLRCLHAARAAKAGTTLEIQIRRAISNTARRHRYVPWAAEAPFLTQLRNQHLTIPTSAAGVWTGFEQLEPPVQGNSETGHQQIANLRVAPQTTLEITRSIADGAFFRNNALRGALERALRSDRAINFCFMLSGVTGSDGRVHSAWNHLEAFLRLIFEHLRAPPSRVRMQAILDGRDSPARASLVQQGEVGAYLDRLQTLLARYRAQESLAWIVGRSIAMDRDFREPNVAADYLLLTKGKGQSVFGFEGAERAIAAAHRRGLNDPEVPPIAVLASGAAARTVQSGDAFVNLNFRPDRQRAKTAALIGAREFLNAEGQSRGHPWTLEWLDDDLKLDICTISEVHPDFERRHDVKVAYTVKPLRDNLLALWPTFSDEDHYALIAESNKSAHMGYFIRGRRERPAAAATEDRTIIPSYGEKDGILSDSEFYKTPGMKNTEIAAAIIDQIGRRRPRLICANISNCDMVGHLLPQHLDEAVEAYQALDATLSHTIPHARNNGYSVIVTSDHGNIEDDTPSHTTNDILTTAAKSRGLYTPAVRDTFQARLFDVSWTLGAMLGRHHMFEAHARSTEGADPDDPFLGRSIIDPEADPG